MCGDYMCDEWTLVPGGAGLGATRGGRLCGRSSTRDPNPSEWKSGDSVGGSVGGNECTEGSTVAPTHYMPWHTTLPGVPAHTALAASRRPVSPLTSPSRISQAEEKLYTLVEHVPVASFKELETKVVEDMGDDE